MAVKDGLPSTDFSRMNREYIKEVAEGSAGSVLPDIAAADEGKFLGVVSGEAAWATAGGGGGGGGAFLLTPTVGESRITLDKTCTEIETAFAAGLSCVFLTEDDSNIQRWELYLVTHTDVGEELPYLYTFNSFNENTITRLVFGGDSASGYPYMELGG